MKHIEKIVINNARRLGANTKIEFGEGATIILAPNGTGKTTIFEAIELALTGKVKRLEDFQDVIIRNGLSEMSVRLDFSKGKYCQADYARGGVCNQSGNYNELFKFENSLSLPYLFRLTHLLEQRGKEWFVEQKDKDAGTLLSQLPIGKELQEVISKKTSLLRSIGITETSAETAFSEAKKKLLEFEELRVQRDGIAIVTTLIPLGEIVEKLQPISKLTDYEEFNDKHNIIPINAYFEKIKVALKQENNTKENLAIRLSTLKERVDIFVSNLELLNHKETTNSQYLMKIASLSSSIEENKKEINDERKILSDIKCEINELNSVKSKFDEVEQKRNHIIIKKPVLELNEKTLGELNKSYEVTIEYIRKKERLRDEYKLVDEAISMKKKQLVQAEIKSDYQKEWETLSSINNDIIKMKIPEIEKKKADYSEAKLHSDNDVFEAEKVYSTKKIALESLNNASGAIQEAVSCIRKHLSENQRNCPVCQADYEPDKLIKKIETSLETLNPAIPQAIIDEKESLKYLKLVIEKRDEQHKKLLDVISELNIENNTLEDNKKKISGNFLQQFPECKTPDEANNYVEGQIAQIVSEISELEANRNQLELEVTIEEMNNANLKKSEDERSINELTTKNKNLKDDIMTETSVINSINEYLSGRDKELVFQNISFMTIEEAKKIVYNQKLDTILSKNEADLKESQNSLLNENEAISKIKGNQEGICTEWSQAGLEAKPNQEKLKVYIEETSKSIVELGNAITISNVLEQELANWRTAEKFNDVDNKIKNQAGDASEKEYLESLKTSVAQNDSIVQNIIEKKKAMNLFLTNIISESEKINEQVNTINEPWRRLLKRIVINPLISAAPLLSNANSRNRLIAKTSAIIHNQNINITHIASEAQITDLQLTLMLSMANKYQWTPWKALLLDDPTQHHDLVHASSVFDVLRDYIIDLDYQVMMSTHDSIQANFFQRKLENEGIPSKIYQLVSRKDGVTAERMI